MSIKKLEAFLTLMEKISPDKQATLDKYQQDLEFARTIDALFQTLSQTDAKIPQREKKQRSRRNPGILDPFDLYKRLGELGLQQQLEILEVEQLKDIIAEHGMDSSRKAMTWKKQGRLVELIVQTVSRRSRRGDAFRV